VPTQWLAWLDRPQSETWIGSLDGAPAGYFEFEAQPGGTVEIAYVGLLPRFTGRGLDPAERRGPPCLGAGASRIWLHTCLRDDPRPSPAIRPELSLKVYR